MVSTVRLAKLVLRDMVARGQGRVLVTSSSPPPCPTNFFHRAGMDETPVGRSKHKDDPATVAEQGFQVLMKDKDKIVAGSVKTKAQGVANKVLPDRAKAAAHRKMAEPDPE